MGADQVRGLRERDLEGGCHPQRRLARTRAHFQAGVHFPLHLYLVDRVGPQGNIFAAAGSPARVYRIAADGKATIVFAPEELQVQALALAEDGTLFAATSPDGRVYKIARKGTPAEKAATKPPVNTAQNAAANEPGGNRQNASLPVDPDYTATIFFEPKTKYIWDLELDAQGRLYVATGDNGEIFRVDRNGQGSLFFKSDEAHIRSIALDNKQNLIAGSDGSGLIYRISPQGEGFVLYSAPKKEITALAVDQQGNIYAAGVGEKRGSTASTPQSPGTVVPLQPQPGLPAGVVVPLQTLAVTGGSEVYRLAPDGSPRRIWNSATDIVYALAFDASGRLIAGTGNRGRLYSIAPDGTFADLLDASANQVTTLSRAADGGLHVATSNLGKIFNLGSTAGSEGTFESDVFDAHIFSKWGRARIRGTGNIDLFARSGNVDNPDRNWSAWRKVDLQRDIAIDTPPARFLQWRAVLHEGTSGPSLDSVTLYYLPKNVAPVIEEVFVQVGARFPAATHAEPSTINVGSRGGEGLALRQHTERHARPQLYRRAMGRARRQRRRSRLQPLVSRRRRIALEAVAGRCDRQVPFFRCRASPGWRLHDSRRRQRRALAFTARCVQRAESEPAL